MNSFIAKVFKINFYILIFFSSGIISPQYLVASDKEENSQKETQYKSAYLLGPGDSLTFEFESLNFLNNIFVINEEGNLVLPDIGEYSAKSKTIKELKIELNEKYKKYIYNPKINIAIFKKRPVVVTLRGEANRTGLYKFKYEDIDLGIIDSTQFSGLEKNNNFLDINSKRKSNFQNAPRLFDLIQRASGVTSNANLSEIVVVRNNSPLNGGGKIKTKINLLALIQEGDQTQNIIIQDGDDIFIPKSEKVLLEQIINLNKSNLYIDKMEVYINGNVYRPGRIVLQQGTSLVEAIAASGGKRNLTGKIEFVRLNRNGSTEKRLISFNEATVKGSENNPILINGDMIFVRRNLIGKAGNFIVDYTSPIVSGYGVYKIFE